MSSFQLTACHLQELFDLTAFDTIKSYCTIFSREQSICTQNKIIIKIKFQTRDKNEYSLFLAFIKSIASKYSLLISLFFLHVFFPEVIICIQLIRFKDSTESKNAHFLNFPKCFTHLWSFFSIMLI